MKFFTKYFIQSENFYNWFYQFNLSLEHYIIKENYFRRFGTHEEATEIVNREYIVHCKSFFRDNIMFYNDLSKYILDVDGEFKQLDEYIFFKLCYYGTKFLSIVNECRNFFEEERKRFKENNYPEAIISLSQFKFHDSYAIFEFKNHVLQIIFDPKTNEQKFKFYGVENWETIDFVSLPVLKSEELYEELPGNFVYNTLWYHVDREGGNYLELSIKFTSLFQIK